MAGLNTAQIIDRARSIGRNISDAEAQAILKQAWDQSQYGADERKVMAILSGGGDNQSSNGQSSNNQPQTRDDYLRGLVDEYQRQLEGQTKRGQEFDALNPFNFDEIQARASIEQVYNPAYQNELNDYVKGIELKRKSIQGELDLLRTLNRIQAGAERRNLDEAIRQSEEGYSGAGLFFSGARERGTGMQNIQGQETAQNRESKFQFGQEQGSRNLEGLNVDERAGRRDIGLRKTTDIETELRNLKAEESARREVEKASYIGDTRLTQGMGQLIGSAFSNY